jgi:putative Mg2+ transporter-C (MgtC) family protein
MIMYRKRAIHNLTTAAGVWATAGVGMAIGAGQYLVGVGATILIVAIQYILHLPINSFKTKNYFQYQIVFFNTPDALEKVKALFSVTKFTKVNVTRTQEGLICTAYLTTDLIYKSEYLSEIMEENSFITSVERVDDD